MFEEEECIDPVYQVFEVGGEPVRTWIEEEMPHLDSTISSGSTPRTCVMTFAINTDEHHMWLHVLKTNGDIVGYHLLHAPKALPGVKEKLYEYHSGVLKQLKAKAL
jgi:hypothetical protein